LRLVTGRGWPPSIGWARSLARQPDSKPLRATIERLTGTKMEAPAAPKKEDQAPDKEEMPLPEAPAPSSTGS